MSYSILLTRVEPHPAAVVRERVAHERLSQFVRAACGEAFSFIRAAGSPVPGRNMALYLHDGVVESGVEVSAPFPDNGRVICSQLPGGLVATATHWGPYQGVGDAHGAIRQWCIDHGHEVTGVSWELYGHWLPAWDADPSKIRTDVCYLVHEQTG